MRYFAVTPFSMEKAVKNELVRMNVTVEEVTEGKVYFEADCDKLADVCVNLRSGDRIYREITAFTATSFDGLFDGIRKVKWADIIARDGNICVSAKCARSQLMSPSDVQRISKMAIVRSMQSSGISSLTEKGCVYPIDIHINKDKVTVALDMCGVSLHKRGYRIKNAEAPIRETFASGLIELSGWRGNMPFCDPFCGSGTFVIEAAMKALNIAPGMNRTFACENFKGINASCFENSRSKAKNAIKDQEIFVQGGDILPEMCDMTLYHASRAGVEKFIKIKCGNAKDSIPQKDYGTLMCNPPYGMRLKIENENFYRDVAQTMANYENWNKFFFSGDVNFEKNVGKHAQKVRRFYNGNIECNFYNYFCKK